MKKVISLILCVVLVGLSLSISYVYAETDSLVLVSNANVTAGDEFEVVLSVSSEEYLCGLELDVQYNDAFELISVELIEDVFDTESFQGSESFSSNPYYMSWDYSIKEPVLANGNLARFKFKTNENCYNGEYKISPKIITAFDVDLHDVDFEIKNGVVTVTGGKTPESQTTTKTTTTTTTTKTTTTTTKTSTQSSSQSTSQSTTVTVQGGEVALTPSQVSFVNCKYFAGTNTSGSESLGYLAKTTKGAFNATDKFFAVKFDQSIFDLNPLKLSITLRAEGAKFSGYYCWFSNSSYTSLQTAPAIQSTNKRVFVKQNTWFDITTNGTTFNIDLTKDTYKEILANKFNYFYICANRANASVTSIYCDSAKLIIPETKPEIDISTKVAASLRLNEMTGIRFYTQVDKNQVATLKNEGYNVELGTLIAPEDLIQDELTFECDKYVYVPFQNVDDKGDLIYYSDGDFTGIVGSIVNLFESNISRNFVGRGYAKITKDDETTIIYSNTVSTRSAKFIANEICSVPNWENNYSLEQVELIDKWSKSN